MKKTLRYPLLFLVILLVTITFFYGFSQEKSKMAYVDNTVLFSDFLMTKEMQAKSSKKIQQQEQTLDSLYRVIQTKEANLSENDRNLLSQELNQLQQIKKQYSDQTMQQVWSRLNQYVQLYGKENGYTFILGAQGTGNVMYAEEAINITDEVLKFANYKYQGN